MAEADVLVIGVIHTSAGPAAAPGLAGVDEALGGTLAGTLSALGATGELEEISKVPGGGKLPATLVLAVGLGEAPADGAPFDAERLRRAAGAALRSASARKPGGNGDDAPVSKAVTLALPALTPDEAEAVTTGALLGAYSFRKYRSTPAADLAVTVLTGGGNSDAVRRGQVVAKAVNLVRDLVNTAPVDLPPAGLAAEAERAAAAAGVAVEVLDEAALKDGGFGGLIGVGQGSIRPPRLIRLVVHAPGGDADRRFRRQGHHVRLRRPVAQAAQVHGDDEVRHERRRRRARRDRRRRRPGAAGQRGRLPVRRGEHAGRRRAAAV